MQVSSVKKETVASQGLILIGILLFPEQWNCKKSLLDACTRLTSDLVVYFVVSGAIPVSSDRCFSNKISSPLRASRIMLCSCASSNT